MRCPYCRRIMADDSHACPGCGSVRENGRWVRRSTGTAPRPAPAAIPAAAVASPAGEPPVAGWGGRGCLAAALGVGLVAVVLVVVGLVVASGRSPAPAVPRWSEAYAATFESACAATGAGTAYCRCARIESERRVPEQEMLRFQRLLATGRSLDAADARTLRDVERRCRD